MATANRRKRKAKVIDYYFSLLSDWAYFGGERLEQLARRYGATINHMPIDLPGIYQGSGGISLRKRSWQRQQYRVVELARWGRRLGMPVVIQPKHYPTDDELAECMIIAAKRARLDAGLLINALHRAIWAQEQDLSDPDTLIKIADGLGMDGAKLVDKARKKIYRDAYLRNTKQALKRGVFGSPFYFYEGDYFWGQDQLGLLEELLSNQV